MSDINPYQPPASPEIAQTPVNLTDAPAPWRQLYSITQIGVAAFLGGPMAGCWLISRNYRELDNHSAFATSVVTGLFGTIALLAVVIMLPEDFPTIPLHVACVVVISQIAKQLQGETLTAHQAAGGSFASWWAAVGWSLLIGTLVTVAAVAFEVVVMNAEL
jgi:hypothetical protein